MKTRNPDPAGKRERVVLIGMVTDPIVLGRIAGKWPKRGLFDSKAANVVGGLCVRYYGKYGKAPGRQIETLFVDWSEDRSVDKTVVREVEGFLGQLSGQYARLRKDSNSNFVLDVADRHFNDVQVRRALEESQAEVDAGDSSKAWERLLKARRVEIGSSAGIKFASDNSYPDVVLDESQNEVLLKYPGALGRLFGNAFERDSFVAFMGPEKSGKTFWLMDVAWRAMLQRKRVAFFEVGDLSQRQILRRFYTRLVGRPLHPTRADRPVFYPKQIDNSGEKPVVMMEERRYDKSVSGDEIRKGLERLRERRLKSKEDFLQVFTYPNSTMTVSGISSILKDLQSIDNWLADMVVIDYADILAPPAGFQGESRDGINENWKAMRRLSQEMHCSVVTATQANAAAYTTNTLSMANFSEDKRKYAHVTGMVAINNNSTDRETRTMRLGWLTLREDEFLMSDEVTCAHCLAIANPAVISV